MTNKSGQISVNTENIFPIIRKWLYSDHDIFLRELISNATDAIKKYERLVQFGEIKGSEDAAFRIDVAYDAKDKTLRVTDNGIGMTADEVEQYINQIAFSGALDFVEKYKEKSDGSGIIGHFGLGFYSVFMVSEHVTIDTLSYQEGSEAVRWTSDDGQEFTLKTGEHPKRGTCVTLYLDQEAEKLFDAAKLREILHKYCAFMPYPIYFRDLVGDAKAAKEEKKYFKERMESYEKRRKEALDKGEAFDEAEPVKQAPASEEPINDTAPLWLKKHKDCTDEEYKAFYRKTFNDYREPLFWIHLNMDYPFRVQGILYFPQSENKYETLDGRIKLYNNQVFVADNIKEVIPDFLFLLKGVLDCPDLPLNVSRSFLQNDAYVKKLSEHIIRKVADRLTKMFKDERTEYEKYWPDIAVFVKYGCLREEKFYDRVKDVLLFKTVDGEFKTVKELGEKIYYVAEPDKQAVYIRRVKGQGHTVVILDHELDTPFMQFMEDKQSPLKFTRVDAVVEGSEVSEEEAQAFSELFRKASRDAKLKVETKAMGASALPAMLKESEESRRMQDMRKSFAMMNGDMDMDSLFPIERELLVNSDHELIQRVRTLWMTENSPREAESTIAKEAAEETAAEETAAKEAAEPPAAETTAADSEPLVLSQAERLAQAIYQLALLGHGSLTADALADFVDDSVKLLDELAGFWKQS